MWILGHDFNIIWSILIFFTLFMVLYSGVISLLENHLPTAVLELFRYGKALNGPVKSSLVGFISVPKSYFTHFYIFSSIYVPSILILTISHYVYNNPVSPRVINFLDVVCTMDRSANTDTGSVLLALSLMTLQVFRRLYECVFVNQPSSSTMNITHYIVGFAHYFCVGSGIICEAPGFVVSSSLMKDHSFFIPTSSLALSVIFVTAWFFQFKTHKIFAHLKIQNKNQHAMPSGSLFEFVSCPHYLCEIILYSCIMLILGLDHSTGVLIWFWVLVNQMIAATMSHQWYLSKFEDYPRSRKAVIPFVW